MPRRQNPVPAYRLHRPTGQAYVRVPDGAGGRRFVYLGAYNSPESKEAYERVLAELRTAPEAARAATPVVPAVGPDPSVNEVLLAFWEYAQAHYRRPDGTATNEVMEYKLTGRAVRELYGHTPAKEFGPRALKAVRRRMVGSGLCRSVVNARVNRVRRIFKWAAAEELIPFAAYHALTSVAGLQRGRTDAPEPEPVVPVPPEVVADTLPFLPVPVRAMAELQRLTGMRPGEVCTLRAADIDRKGPVWVYRPPQHKTAWRGKGRAVFIGPRAQALLAPWLLKAGVGFVFSPARWVREWNAARSAARVTPLYPSHARRNAARRAANPSRPPADRYTTMSYDKAIARGVRRATADRRRHDVPEGAHGPNLPSVPHWHPNQLRHTFATAVRERHGLEAVQALLGHEQLSTSEVYAEKSHGLATRVAAEVG